MCTDTHVHYTVHSNSLNTKHTSKHIRLSSRHAHTQPVLHLSVCSSPPPADVLARDSAELSWRAADGTGSLLLSFIEHYLFYSFSSADSLLQVASLATFSWNDPIFPSRANSSSLFFFVFLLNFHFVDAWKQLVIFALPSLSTGILKFHEVYLGEGVSEGGSEFQEGGSSGVVCGSSLEQHIASAREALGVESYYSRWDVYSCHNNMKILLSVC